MLHDVVVTLFIIALILANLPWLHERLFVFFAAPGGHKPLWLCLLEWFVYFILWLVLAFGLEKKLMGDITHQGWEFYVITLCLFVVFALPGFIYRYDLRPHLDKRERRSK
jgi:peptidoglycan/LPS O-acetylase OafA/YrhL